MVEIKQSTYRIARHAGYQGARPPVGRQAGVEKHTTGCGRVSMPSNENHKRHYIMNNHHKKHQKKQTNNLKIGSINVQTAKEEVKLAEYIIHLKNIKQDICFFQETRICGNGELEFEDQALKGWKVLYSGFKKRIQAGVAIVLAPHIKVEDIMYVEDGRIIGARIIVNGLRLSVFSCYAPTDTKSYSDQQKTGFYTSLKKATTTVKKNFPGFKLIIGGDFNATIGNDCQTEKWRCIGDNNDPDPTSENGMRLLDYCEEQNLFVMNSRFGYKNIHRWSFYSNLGYKRRLDYIIGEWFVLRFCTNCRVYRNVSDGFESDHKIVVMDCYFPSMKSIRKIFTKKKTVKKPLDIKKLRVDNQIVLNYTNMVDANLDNMIENITDINEISERITKVIQDSSNKTIPTRNKKLDDKPWINDTFLALIKDRNNAVKKDERKELNKQIKKIRDKLKNEYYNNKASAINMASKNRDVEEEFRIASNYTAVNKSKKLLIAPDKLKSHFQEHFAPRQVKVQPEVENPSLFPHILPPKDSLIDERPPTEDEVKKAVGTLKNNKCAGTDEIYAEQLKYCNSGKLMSLLLLLLTCIWSTVSVPKTWLEAVISCIHKKGPKDIAKNYRSIFIMNTISRLLPKIIIERLRDAYEKLLMANQFGFRKNRSTTDAIFIVREALKSTKKPIYLCMIDLKAAYDHLDRDMLFRVLDIRTKAPLLIAILKALYTETIAAIKHTTGYFQVHTGCRQGGIESPVLFNIYMDFALRCAEHEVLAKYPNTGLKYSYRINLESSTREQRKIHGLSGNDRLGMLLYADDIVLFCEDIDELQSIIIIYDKTFKRFGLTIAIDKTKTIPFNVPEEVMNLSSLINLNEQPIENVRRFKYLGHMLTNETVTTPTYITNQISSAYIKWNELKPMLMNKQIKLSTRVKFLEAYVRSRLLYSVQAWQLNANEMRKVESVWNNFLRRMIKGGFERKNVPKSKDEIIPVEEINWAYKINNQMLREITKTTELKHFCEMQHLKYVAHVIRNDNNSIQKRLLFCDTRSNRWKRLASYIGVDETQLRKTMMDKNKFNRLVNELMN